MRIACFALFWAGLATAQVLELDDAAKRSVRLDLRSGDKPTAVIFVSTNCPISNAFNDRLSDLYRAYAAKGVRFVVVNSNVNETPKEIAEHASAAGFPFPVYRDRANAAADLLGAEATPEAFVLDAAGVRYHGYIEDSMNEARVKRHSLRDALDSLLAGKPAPVTETKAFGCTIKRAKRIKTT